MAGGGPRHDLFHNVSIRSQNDTIFYDEVLRIAGARFKPPTTGHLPLDRAHHRRVPGRVALRRGALLSKLAPWLVAQRIDVVRRRGQPVFPRFLRPICRRHLGLRLWCNLDSSRALHSARASSALLQ